MTNNNFKKALQNEINSSHVSVRNPIKETGDNGVNLWIKFNYPIDADTRKWLQNRFMNGVTFSIVEPYSTIGNENLALINTPNQNNK